jgi:hypothetical protein
MDCGTGISGIKSARTFVFGGWRWGSSELVEGLSSVRGAER